MSKPHIFVAEVAISAAKTAEIEAFIAESHNKSIRLMNKAGIGQVAIIEYESGTQEATAAKEAVALLGNARVLRASYRPMH